MSTTTLEYSYEGTGHLTEKEALDAYKKALMDHPDALTILDDLDCGHWNVQTYNTELEKQLYYRKLAYRRFIDFLAKFMKRGS